MDQLFPMAQSGSNVTGLGLAPSVLTRLPRKDTHYFDQPFFLALIIPFLSVVPGAGVRLAVEERGSMTKQPKDFRKPDDEALKERLTQEQYEVTQNEGTERPFQNLYWNNHEPGIYVDVVSGEPLFSSLDKFDSGTGWPSFTRPLAPDNLVSRADHSSFMTRIEIRSRHGDSHLGHLFDDGPPPTGRRYCMNSASLRFVPVSKLQEEGYGEYLPLFQKTSPSGGVR